MFILYWSSATDPHPSTYSFRLQLTSHQVPEACVCMYVCMYVSWRLASRNSSTDDPGTGRSSLSSPLETTRSLSLSVEARMNECYMAIFTPSIMTVKLCMKLHPISHLHCLPGPTADKDADGRVLRHRRLLPETKKNEKFLIFVTAKIWWRHQTRICTVLDLLSSPVYLIWGTQVF